MVRPRSFLSRPFALFLATNCRHWKYSFTALPQFHMLVLKIEPITDHRVCTATEPSKALVGAIKLRHRAGSWDSPPLAGCSTSSCTEAQGNEVNGLNNRSAFRRLLRFERDQSSIRRYADRYDCSMRIWCHHSLYYDKLKGRNQVSSEPNWLLLAQARHVCVL